MYYIKSLPNKIFRRLIHLYYIGLPTQVRLWQSWIWNRGYNLNNTPCNKGLRSRCGGTVHIDYFGSDLFSSSMSLMASMLKPLPVLFLVLWNVAIRLPNPDICMTLILMHKLSLSMSTPMNCYNLDAPDIVSRWLMLWLRGHLGIMPCTACSFLS